MAGGADEHEPASHVPHDVRFCRPGSNGPVPLTTPTSNDVPQTACTHLHDEANQCSVIISSSGGSRCACMSALPQSCVSGRGRLQAMGDKTLARQLAEECGVPCVPGTKQATDTTADALQFVREHGLPVILKAAMGGGGRGMRVVRSGGGPCCRPAPLAPALVGLCCHWDMLLLAFSFLG